MTTLEFHPVDTVQNFVEVVLPLALPKTYTYSVPEQLLEQVKFGVRVEVQFGRNKLYTALVVGLHREAPAAYTPKPILSVIDEQPLFNPTGFKFWQWLADYYACTLGEVMHAALPGNMKLASETVLSLSPVYDGNMLALTDKEYLVAEALTVQSELTIEEVRKILQQKTVYGVIRSLLEKKVIYLQEDLVQKYAPKTVACVRLQEPFRSQPDLLSEAFDQLSRSTRQIEALMAFIQLSKRQPFIRKQDIYNKASVDSSVINALVKKEIFEVYDREVSRLGGYEEETVQEETLSTQQEQAIEQITGFFDGGKQTVLLHGVTGSGKTRVFVEYMRKVINSGGQVLYLLPEIALTTQIVQRLQKVFGEDIAVYHSKLNNNERVEVWNAVAAGQPMVLGARSGLLLPFENLQLIIVDEEHDTSYKQNDPNPRYNARDAAGYLAVLHGAKVLLGTATPSLESYANAQQSKYGWVNMPERFGGLQLPETVVVDMKQEQKLGKMQSHFSSVLLDELKLALERGEQAILFQNRRGYAPTLRCQSCGWHSTCVHCDVSLTYHKGINQLKCHYCGYQVPVIKDCPACGARQLLLQGFGTEKIEDEVQLFLPEVKVGRLDLETVRSKNAYARILNDFEERRLDILVGTQMVTKGLDFENVGVVGILSADQLLQFPDFRAAERAFQLMVQVSGRAGRKHRQGKVVIQAANVSHPVLRDVLNNDFRAFVQREMAERHAFHYPPYTRLIHLEMKHAKPEILNKAGDHFAKRLRPLLGEWLIGPAVPHISRIRGQYLLHFLVKLPKDPGKINYAKSKIQDGIAAIQSLPGCSGVRVNVDVDPY